MSYGWGPDQHGCAARIREEVVSDVVERGICTVGVAATWGVQVDDVDSERES